MATVSSADNGREQEASAEDEVEWVEDGEEEEEAKVALGMVGKIWTERNVNSNALIATMKRVLNPKHGMEANCIGKNMFFFQFHHWKDKDFVMDMQPWHFDRHALVLNDIQGNVKPSDIPLYQIPFWVRVYDLPFKGRNNESNAKIIGYETLRMEGLWWMPVRATLGHRHIIPSKTCVICEGTEETITHALFECNWVKDFWLNGEFKDRLSHGPTDFGERLGWIFQNFNKDETQRILAWTWGIWAGRNEIVFNQGDPDVGKITGGFFRLVMDYCVYAPRVFPKQTHFQVNSNARWIVPDLGVIKINTDAALIGNEYVGLGAVLRNHDGAIVAAGVSRIKATWPVVMAEMAAARWGMSVASRLGVQKVQLETDAMEVVRMVKTQAKGFSILSLILEDIHHLSWLCDSFSISHVKRVGNSVAHLMARFIPTFGNDCIFLSNFPQGILTLADMDVR